MKFWLSIALFGLGCAIGSAAITDFCTHRAVDRWYAAHWEPPLTFTHPPSDTCEEVPESRLPKMPEVYYFQSAAVFQQGAWVRFNAYGELIPAYSAKQAIGRAAQYSHERGETIPVILKGGSEW